jgi:hypothetical protein
MRTLKQVKNMELPQILERLDYTIMKAKELKPEQFSFESYVSVFDEVNNCGTVCCIAGHYPNWGIDEFFFEDFAFLFLTVASNLGDNISISLSKYHGLGIALIGYLFDGCGDYFTGLPYYRELSDYSLVEVIQRFEHVRNLLASGEIEPNQVFF